MQKIANITTAAVEAADSAHTTPEFGRVRDVERLFGVKRSTLYTLLRDGKIRGCVLRVRGRMSGVRLFDLDSVRSYIKSQMQQAGKEVAV